MPKPRRIWLLAGAFALVLGVIAWRSLSLPAQPSMTLTFLGYTNVMVSVKSAAYGVSLPAARVLATNTGPVAVELIPIISSEKLVFTGRTISPIHDVCMVRNLQSPQFLNPGEAIVFEAVPQPDSKSWEVQLAYHARSTHNEVLGRLSKGSNPTMRRLLGRFYRVQQTFWVELGPFKDLPPTVMPEMETRKVSKALMMPRQTSTNWVWLSTLEKTNQILPPPPSPAYRDGLRLY